MGGLEVTGGAGMGVAETVRGTVEVGCGGTGIGEGISGMVELTLSTALGAAWCDVVNVCGAELSISEPWKFV